MWQGVSGSRRCRASHHQGNCILIIEGFGKNTKGGAKAYRCAHISLILQFIFLATVEDESRLKQARSLDRDCRLRFFTGGSVSVIFPIIFFVFTA